MVHRLKRAAITFGTFAAAPLRTSHGWWREAKRTARDDEWARPTFPAGGVLAAALLAESLDPNPGTDMIFVGFA
jgi:hypothetical protein